MSVNSVVSAVDRLWAWQNKSRQIIQQYTFIRAHYLQHSAYTYVLGERRTLY